MAFVELNFNFTLFYPLNETDDRDHRLDIDGKKLATELIRNVYWKLHVKMQ